MTSKLVEGWRRAWRWHSAQALAALTLLPVVWIELPADLKTRIPEGWEPYIISVVALAGLIGRLRSQSK